MTVNLSKPIDRLYEHKLINEQEGTLHLTVAAWGDYGGSILDRANARYLTTNYPDVINVRHGWYSSESLYLTTRYLTDDVVDAIIGASEYADYPILDEEMLSEIESELRDEAWSDWQIREVKREIEAAWNVEEFDDTFPGITDEDIRWAFETTFEAANCGENGYAETATSWVWSSTGEKAAREAFLDAIAALMVADLPATGYGQLTLI